MNVDAIFPKMQEIVAEVLMIDEEDVKADSRLIADLGAESIDFLDLVFQLEKEFDIKIPRGQLEKEARGSLTDEQFESDGVITDAGMTQIRTYFSEVPAAHFPSPMKVSEIPTIFTGKSYVEVSIE